MKRINEKLLSNKRFKNLTLLKKSSTHIPPSPDKSKLETFTNIYSDRDYWIEFICPEYTSICPVTGQPDFGTIIIKYIPRKLCLESKSLKIYLMSFRNWPTFHEEAVNRIRDDIAGSIKPKKLIVRGEFKPRGGISINVIATYPNKQINNI